MSDWKDENEGHEGYGVPPLSKVYSPAVDLDGDNGKKGCKSDDGHTEGLVLISNFIDQCW